MQLWRAQKSSLFLWVLALILSGKEQMKGQKDGSAVGELAHGPECLSWILRTNQVEGGNPLRKVVLNITKYANWPHSQVHMHTPRTHTKFIKTLKWILRETSEKDAVHRECRSWTLLRWLRPDVATPLTTTSLWPLIPGHRISASSGV